MKQKYADTIRAKVEAGKHPAPKKEDVPFRPNAFNRLFWPILISPAFTLLYIPVNRYITLPLFGSGRPYTDLSGEYIENYFSANSVALILFYLLLAASEILIFHTSKKLPKWKRTFFFIGCTVINLLTAILFLEFTLWE